MIELLKNFEDNVCLSYGICSNDPRVNVLGELLLNEIKQIAFYVVKMAEFNHKDKKIISNALGILGTNFVAGNINEQNYVDLYGELVQERIEIQEEYENYCKKNNTTYELLKGTSSEHLKNSFLKMLKEGERFLSVKNNLVIKDENRLFDLILLVIKNACINLEKIKAYDKNFTIYDFEIIRMLNLLNFPSTRATKLKRRMNEFLKIYYKIQKKLIASYEKAYGERTSAKINLNHKKGKSILVSGDNLKELETLLEQIGDKKINVYTHGKLFLAHTYPKFKKYKNLIGHFGTNDPKNDFAAFKGAILVTKNHNQKIDTIYRGLIYSSDILSPRGIVHVLNNNFSELIEAAQKAVGFLEDEGERNVLIKYNKEEIDKGLERGHDMVIFVGYSIAEKTDMADLNFENKSIINFDYPLETDLIMYISEHAKQKNINLSVFFSKCYPQTLSSALLLHVQKVTDIYFMECEQHFIHPRIIECLKKDFGIKFLK